MTHYRLSFNGHIHLNQANEFRNRTATILARDDFESLTYLFASEGGSTDQGLSLYNFIRTLPVPVHMHAVGHVGSMAIPVFLAGRKRTCTPYSRFFFHAYDWGFEGRQMSDRIAEALKRLDSDIQLSCEIAARHTIIDPNLLKEIYGRAPTPTIFSATQAKEVGIVEDILELNPKAENQPGVSVWTTGAGA